MISETQKIAKRHAADDVRFGKPQRNGADAPEWFFEDHNEGEYWEAYSRYYRFADRDACILPDGDIEF